MYLNYYKNIPSFRDKLMNLVLFFFCLYFNIILVEYFFNVRSFKSYKSVHIEMHKIAALFKKLINQIQWLTDFVLVKMHICYVIIWSSICVKVPLLDSRGMNPNPHRTNCLLSVKSRGSLMEAGGNQCWEGHCRNVICYRLLVTRAATNDYIHNRFIY